jgi:Tfp pilus assembly protein PilV
MGNEKGFAMWETIFSMILLSLVLFITPLFIQTVESGNKAREMDYSAQQLAQTLLEGWKNGEQLTSGEKRGMDGRKFDVEVILMKESPCVEQCQLIIRWEGIQNPVETRTMIGYRYVETGDFYE